MTTQTLRRTARIATLTVAACALLASCGLRDRILPGRSGQAAVVLPYRATLQRDAGDPRSFTVTARADVATLDDVRESLRFPATRYCLETFGGSEVAWVLDPATRDWAIAAGDSGVTASGRCLSRG